MSISKADFEGMRLMARVLTLHYEEGHLQSRIAMELGLSPAKVNRLIKQGRESGMLKISVDSPFQRGFELEQNLTRQSNLKNCLVVSAEVGSSETTLSQVGKGAAKVLLENLKDGDTICVSGGKGVSAVVEGLNPDRAYDVEVVPATGCVQDKFYTDVNHVAAQLAEKLGGRAWQIHAPLFAETPEQKEMLTEMRAVKEILERARNATIAIVGVGSILSDDSSYYDLHPTAKSDQSEIRHTGAVAELLAHLLDKKGNVCNYELNSRLVALSPEDFSRVPLTRGVASGENKIEPICSMLRGNHLKSLVVDEQTAIGVLQTL